MAGQITADVAELLRVKEKVDSNILEMEEFHKKISQEINSLETNKIFVTTQASKSLLSYFESLSKAAQQQIQELRNFNDQLSKAAANYEAREQSRAASIKQAGEKIVTASQPLNNN